MPWLEWAGGGLRHMLAGTFLGTFRARLPRKSTRQTPCSDPPRWAYKIPGAVRLVRIRLRGASGGRARQALSCVPRRANA